MFHEYGAMVVNTTAADCAGNPINLDGGYIHIPPKTGGAAPCPPLGAESPEKLYFLTRTPDDGVGVGPGRLLAFGGSELDDGKIIIAEVQPREHDPSGIGKTTVFHKLFLTFMVTGDAEIRVLPILDGVELTAEMVEKTYIGTGTVQRDVVEIALTRPITIAGVRRGRGALRGTWLTFRVELVDICSQGLRIEKAEVEVEEYIEEEVPQTAAIP
jgi:hypothetical protein